MKRDVLIFCVSILFGFCLGKLTRYLVHEPDTEGYVECRVVRTVERLDNGQTITMFQNACPNLNLNLNKDK